LLFLWIIFGIFTIGMEFPEDEEINGLEIFFSSLVGSMEL